MLPSRTSWISYLQKSRAHTLSAMLQLSSHAQKKLRTRNSDSSAAFRAQQSQSSKWAIFRESKLFCRRLKSLTIMLMTGANRSWQKLRQRTGTITAFMQSSLQPAEQETAQSHRQRSTAFRERTSGQSV